MPERLKVLLGTDTDGYDNPEDVHYLSLDYDQDRWMCYGFGFTPWPCNYKSGLDEMTALIEREGWEVESVTTYDQSEANFPRQKICTLYVLVNKEETEHV